MFGGYCFFFTTHRILFYFLNSISQRFGSRSLNGGNVFDRLLDVMRGFCCTWGTYLERFENQTCSKI